MINPAPAVPLNQWDADFAAYKRRNVMENPKIKRWELTLSPMAFTL
jgi:hypothetical protein